MIGLKFKWKPLNAWQFSEDIGENHIQSFAEFNGNIFIGLGTVAKGTPGNSRDLAEIIGYSPTYSFQSFKPQSWADQPPYGGMMPMCVYKNKLYVGDDRARVSYTSEGLHWESLTLGNFPDPDHPDDLVYRSINYMTCFKDYLFISHRGHAEIHRISWPEGAPKPDIKKFANLPIDTALYPKAKVEAMEVFGDYLYVGVGRDNNNGADICRTEDGETWEKFHEINQFKVGHIHAMKAFKGELYIGLYSDFGIGQGSDEGGLCRTDGSLPPSSTHWEKIAFPDTRGIVFRLEVYNDMLLMGLSYFWSESDHRSDNILYYSNNGADWKPINVPLDLPYSNANWITALYKPNMTIGGKPNQFLVGTHNPDKNGLLVLRGLYATSFLDEIKKWVPMVAWAFMIVIGGLLITPGGYMCIKCGVDINAPGYIGDMFVQLAGIASIGIGTIGVATEAKNNGLIYTLKGLFSGSSRNQK